MNNLKLYCQNCCARYDYCIDKNTLHPYDKAAETCPDFLPKDIYKAIQNGTDNFKTNLSKTPCFHKRRMIEPDFRPLPEIFPISYWTKEQLEKAREYALNQMKKEGV